MHGETIRSEKDGMCMVPPKVPKTIGVLTSGGDAPGMNGAIRAVVRAGHFHGIKPVGIFNGYAGLMEGRARALELRDVGDIIHRGGTILRSARAPALARDAGRGEALRRAAELGLDGLVVIGGDGSLRGALGLFEAGLPVVGIPATIDNDVGGTERSIGFDTAVNTVVQAINRIRDTASAHERTFIIEVMGRDSGFIALAAGLAGGAESVLVPEQTVDYAAICRRLERGFKRGKAHSIIVVAEGAGVDQARSDTGPSRGPAGAPPEPGEPGGVPQEPEEPGGAPPAPGELGGAAYKVAAEIRRRTGLETRVTVLGHIQRGGTPTAADRILGSRLGAAAVEALRGGTAGVAVGVMGENTVSVPLEDAVTHRPVPPMDWIELAQILGI